MKKVIDGKVYDTQKAKFIYNFEDTLYVHTLYKKRTGEYFIHTLGYNSLGVPHDTIRPIDIDTAKKILKPYEDAYNKEFGFTDEKEILSISISKESSKYARKIALHKGISLSAAIDDMIYYYCSNEPKND